MALFSFTAVRSGSIAALKLLTTILPIAARDSPFDRVERTLQRYVGNLTYAGQEMQQIFPDE
jgi:hypothetical protein